MFYILRYFYLIYTDLGELYQEVLGIPKNPDCGGTSKRVAKSEKR